MAMTDAAFAVAADLLDPPPPDRSLEELGCEGMLQTLFPAYFPYPFAPHQHDFWEWVWSLEAKVTPKPFVAVWNRGGAKSTSAEGAVALTACRQTRRYGLYVSSTQPRADDHVANIASLLESDAVAEHYPLVADRALGKFGSPKGWRRNRLRTRSGFTVDAVGLDVAARGVKIDEDRPDFIVYDDVDDKEDTEATIEKKLRGITEGLIPAGAPHCAHLFIQNVVHPNSIAARLVSTGGEDEPPPAGFLTNRIVSGPIPAVVDPDIEDRGPSIDGNQRYVIRSGTPTWPEGMGLEACTNLLNFMGLTAFQIECQHEVKAPPGGVWDHVQYARCTPGEVPRLERVSVWVDPAVTETDKSDSHGLQCDGIDSRGVIYRLRSWERVTSPEDALKRAIGWAIEYGASRVGVETDQGGDTWRSVFQRAMEAVNAERVKEGLPPVSIGFTSAKAGQGYGSKAQRNSQMLHDYELPNRIVHVLGTHHILEAALDRFPRKPLDLADVAFWSWADLRGKIKAKAAVSSSRPSRGTSIPARRSVLPARH